METKIILVRHGETDWNRELRFQGSKDIQLNDNGIEQAEKLAQRLAAEEIDVIYASDLERAYKTAKTVAKEHDLEVDKFKELQEISFGQWEGLTYNQIQEKYQAEWAMWEEDPALNGAPEGESLKDVQERSIKKLEEIISRHLGNTILIVSHGGVIKVLISTLFGIPLAKAWQLMQSNTSVNIINYYEEDKVALELFNCTKHLED
ncbi:alpha-ribazole phosphatase/probable phosphoglycerate mutase [Orenia metallireducens]|jgi:alpha-ribazole phosphatase|uniref:Alpha-ribazole phosphatase n=1 Tax=Orenia metallireducens TaxID=1413210 RepID=A0A285GPH7_9FIRM|nr:alpha-ribazole phosphatase [Orenia metallireducens]PRX29865.1 alpha-ribazole phosphatase/probable phosphoglycerate mutase [Orenia metallireducens]SNY25385.1 alpha-ribazole phosphatase/probable phosphoglycerate mutase [Orenia metallireducens]